MVTHKVGELVLMAFTIYDKPVRLLGVIKKVHEQIKFRSHLVEWFDGTDSWYSSESIEEMKSDLWSYLEA